MKEESYLLILTHPLYYQHCPYEGRLTTYRAESARADEYCGVLWQLIVQFGR